MRRRILRGPIEVVWYRLDRPRRAVVVQVGRRYLILHHRATHRRYWSERSGAQSWHALGPVTWVTGRHRS